MNRPSRSISSVCFVIMVFATLVEFGCAKDNSNSVRKPISNAESAATATTEASATPVPHHTHATQKVFGSQAAPAAPNLFPFLGNLTALNVAAPQAVALKRQGDCSLLFAAFDYTLNSTTADFTINTMTPGYEKTLHDNAFLTTTPDVFAKGCVDSNIGYGPRITANLGLAKNGQIIGAAFSQEKIIWAGLNSDGTNSQPSTQPVDIGPVTILNGDLNKDGNQDLITINTNGSSGSVGVYLGTDAGGFGPETVIALPGEEVGFGILDDMNGDGKLDLVVSIGTGDQFQFLMFLGKGDGTFNSPVAYSPNLDNLDFFTPFVTADVNGDGHEDIVTTLGDVFLGQASGTNFTFKGVEFPPVSNASNMYAPGIVAADLNKDGKIDIAIDPGGSIQTFLGNGDGTFSVGLAYASIANRGFITATDLDGDGNMDLFSGFGNSGGYGGDDYLPNQAYALLGNGDGSFAGAPSVPISYTGTNLLDLNGDGRPDLVGWVFNSTQNSIVTYLTGSNGIPVAGPQVTLASGLQVDSYATGGLHTKSNATPDLIFLDATTGGQLFHVYLGAGDGSFNSPTTFPLPTLVPTGFDINPVATGLRLGDFNGDGILDIAYTFEDEANDTQIYYEGLAVQLGNGDGTFAAPKITYTYQSATAPLFAFSNLLSLVTDVNKDGFADAFLILPPAATGNPYTVQLFIGNGDGTFQSPNTLTVTPYVSVPTGDGVFGTPFALADLNGDGKLDLVTAGSSADQSTPEIAITLGNGDGTFQPPTILQFQGFGYAGSPALADFDGDGKIDLYLSGIIEGLDLGIFPGNGDGTFKTISNGDGTVAAPDAVALSLGGGSVAVDLNGDKVPDLIAGSVILINKSNVTPPSTAATSTALTSAPNPSTTGTNVTFTATVTSATAGTITGTVAFFDGATQIGTGTLSAGVASFTTTTPLTQGTHSITAQYGGDSNYSSSTSTAVSQVVNAAGSAATTTALTSSLNPSNVGAGVTFTATVTSTTPGTISGSVSFYDGTKLLDTPITMTGNVATYTDMNLAQGTHTITAHYNGNASYAVSVSSAVSQVVNAGSTAATTTALSASSTNAPSGTNITFTATVTASASTSAPASARAARRAMAAQDAPAVTGIVTFYDGTTQLGTGSVGAGGVATYQNSTLAAGSHSITAQYGGDANYSASTSPAVQVTITPAGGTFTIGAGPSSVSLTPSAPATTTITVTPSGGFNQAVTFSCGAVTSFACAFSPMSVTPNGGAASTMLTITYNPAAARATKQSSLFVGSGGSSGSGGRGSSRVTGRLALALGGELLVLGWLASRKKKSLAQGTGRFAYALVLCALAVTVMAGCGSNSSSPQSTTITVTGTSSTQTATTTVDVSYKN